MRPLVSYSTVVIKDKDGDYSLARSARDPDGMGLVRLWDEGLLLQSRGNDFRPLVVMNSWPAAAPVPDGDWEVSGPHGVRLPSGRLKARNLLESDDSDPLSLPPGGYLVRVARRGRPEETVELGGFDRQEVLEEWTIDLWPATDDEAPPPAVRTRGRIPASARERPPL